MTDPSPASHSAATGADAAPATELAPPPVAPAPGTASVAPGTASDDPPAAPPAGLWDRMKDDPQYAPEHLALEAVRRLGPQARDWAAHSRAGHPGIGHQRSGAPGRGALPPRAGRDDAAAATALSRRPGCSGAAPGPPAGDGHERFRPDRDDDPDRGVRDVVHLAVAHLQ
jgi:hypothetical protein